MKYRVQGTETWIVHTANYDSETNTWSDLVVGLAAGIYQVKATFHGAHIVNGQLQIIESETDVRTVTVAGT
jgi:hypothetical protein